MIIKKPAGVPAGFFIMFRLPLIVKEKLRNIKK